MQVFVVGVALADIAGQTMDGEVHLAQPDGFGHFLLAVDADFSPGFSCVPHEPGALHEHAARTTGRVKDAAVKRFDDPDDELDDGGGGEELAALLAFAHGEMAEEVFVNLAEDVAFDVHGDGFMVLSSSLSRGSRSGCRSWEAHP